jgi:hypothetical protein
MYEVVIWLAASAVAATLITFSVMRRKLSHIEDQAKELSQLDPTTGLLNLRVMGVDYPDLADKRKDRSGSPKLTVSAGIADINPSLDPDDTTAALTNRAEFALIEAKRLNKTVTPLVESFKGTIVSYNGDQYRVL